MPGAAAPVARFVHCMSPRAWPLACLLLAGGLLIKLRLERAWAVPIGFDSGWAFNVIYAAHLTGAVAGAALALLLEACHRLFGRRPPRAAVD